MNWHGCVVVSVVIGSLCSGVPSTAAETNATGAPMFSLAGGVGNSLGWLGVQGERHVREGRFSIFAGVGYGSTFDESPNASGTAAVAAGGRAFFGGRTHRFFVEGSVALIAREWWVDASGTEQQADRYGPGLQVGYQLLSRKGITFMTSVGVGYAVGAHFDTTAVMSGLAVGYTWRRGPARAMPQSRPSSGAFLKTANPSRQPIAR